MEKTFKEKYGGNYIITKSFDCDDVIAYSANLEDAYNAAIRMGVEEPVVDYVEEEGVICLY